MTFIVQDKDRPRGRVLIADDDAFVRRLLLDVCEQQRFIADAVCDGWTAHTLLNCMPRETYDIVFLDLMMPDWDGHDVLAMNELSSRQNVVVVSGVVDCDDSCSADALKMNKCVLGVLCKPFNVEDVERYLNEAAARHEEKT